MYYAAALVFLFALLAISVQAGWTVRFEGWAYQKTVSYMSPALTTLVKGITHLGDTPSVIAICLAFYLLPRVRRMAALPVSAAVIVSALLNTLLKGLFARQRPDILRLINETSYSFPSGHAMNNAALYTMLALLAYYYWRGWPRRLTVAACITLACLISASRVYLGVHYAGDVLGGMLLGTAVALVIFVLWRRRMQKAGLQAGQG